MLSRSYRISVGQFNTVIERGRVAHSTLFLARILKDQPDIRIAAVASKKIAKTAVVRNRIRRKIYEAVRPLKSSLPSSIHVLIFAKAGLLQVTHKEIEADLKNLFVKAGLLR